MTLEHDVRGLPAFAALDGYAVLSGRRRGASIQLDETYFDGRLRALRGFDAVSEPDRRVSRLEAARRTFDTIEVSVDAVTERALLEASARFRRRLEALPEVEFLASEFPGRCFVVPEWLRTGDRLQYGARVYLFEESKGPDPENVVETNVEAVVAGAIDEFERYQGQLHGYPECCIDFYQRHSRAAQSPEWRSMEPFTDRIREDALGQGPDGSLDDVVSPVDEHWDGDACFASAFFPEPGCETATAKGRAVYETLASAMPEQLVRDHFRLNFGTTYLIARTVRAGGDQRPEPGVLGREHLRFSLPLEHAATVPRYG